LAILETLNLYTGLSKTEVYADMQAKIKILKWMTSKNIADVNKIGLLMSKYYRNNPFIKGKFDASAHIQMSATKPILLSTKKEQTNKNIEKDFYDKISRNYELLQKLREISTPILNRNAKN